MGKEYVVKIPSWKKYQNREVKHKSVWLRFQNDFIENPNFYEFTSDERIVWIYTLCCASKLNTDTLQVPHQCSHRVLHRCTGVDEKTFHRAIQKLKQLRLVEIRTTRGRYAHDTFENVNDTLRDETLRDETLRDETLRDETLRDETLRDETAIDFDFEGLYRKYPRKEGKTEGIKRCRNQIKTQEDYDALALAIENYKKRLAREGTEQKFIKHFSSFMSSWRDWIEKDVTTFHGDQPVQPVYKPPEWIKEEPCDPERVRAIVSGVFGSMPKESA